VPAGGDLLLLDREDSLNKLRGQWHCYRPRLVTDEQVAVPAAIPALCTYNPEYLLKTPSQKKAAWADMLMLSAKRREWFERVSGMALDSQ
jgi:DNA polymerase